MSDTEVQKDQLSDNEDSPPADQGQAVSPDKEVTRLKAALAAQQKRAADQAKEFEDFKAEQARLAMTEQQRQEADFKQAQAEAVRLKTALDTQTAANQSLQLLSTAIAKHDLGSPLYGDTVLKGFNPEVQDFDSFMKERKADPEYAPFFKSTRQRAAAPASPGQGSSGATEQGDDVADAKAYAQRTWPGNEAAQAYYLKQANKA